MNIFSLEVEVEPMATETPPPGPRRNYVNSFIWKGGKEVKYAIYGI